MGTTSTGPILPFVDPLMRGVADVLGDGKKNHMGMTLGGTRISGQSRWVLQLRVAFGIGCLVIGRRA